MIPKIFLWGTQPSMLYHTWNVDTPYHTVLSPSPLITPYPLIWSPVTNSAPHLSLTSLSTEWDEYVNIPFHPTCPPQPVWWLVFSNLDGRLHMNAVWPKYGNFIDWYACIVFEILLLNITDGLAYLISWQLVTWNESTANALLLLTSGSKLLNCKLPLKPNLSNPFSNQMNVMYLDRQLSLIPDRLQFKMILYILPKMQTIHQW